ncbi:hypothetical protein CPC08DRAFT_306156 [Agrocybe pediades]|nr:hypothetical protein CPC08DRAFT_306156 [Agrocybe pediades]
MVHLQPHPTPSKGLILGLALHRRTRSYPSDYRVGSICSWQDLATVDSEADDTRRTYILKCASDNLPYVLNHLTL